MKCLWKLVCISYKHDEEFIKTKNNFYFNPLKTYFEDENPDSNEYQSKVDRTTACVDLLRFWKIIN